MARVQMHKTVRVLVHGRLHYPILKRTIGGWCLGPWRFRREREETGWRWWARDSRPGGPRDPFFTLRSAVTFALGADPELGGQT